MNNVYVSPIAKNELMKVAKVIRSNQKYTYVNELDCSGDEKYLAAMWLCVAPQKKYTTKVFNASFTKKIEEDEKNES